MAHIVDDEPRSDCGTIPMRPSDSGRRGASAVSALLDDDYRYRLRRASFYRPVRR